MASRLPIWCRWPRDATDSPARRRKGCCRRPAAPPFCRCCATWRSTPTGAAANSRSAMPCNWRKKKGIANVRMPNGAVVAAEVHWYEAHGIGKVNKGMAMKFVVCVSRKNCGDFSTDELTRGRRVFVDGGERQGEADAGEVFVLFGLCGLPGEVVGGVEARFFRGGHHGAFRWQGGGGLFAAPNVCLLAAGSPGAFERRAFMSCNSRE